MVGFGCIGAGFNTRIWFAHLPVRIACFYETDGKICLNLRLVKYLRIQLCFVFFLLNHIITKATVGRLEYQQIEIHCTATWTTGSPTKQLE